jgi:NADH:ubiquinone oxidoreductase subunit E
MMTGARTGSLIAGSLVVLLVAILLTDYALADRQPFAARPAAEQNKVTAARLARKARDNAVAWALIAAAAAFLTFAKPLVKQQKPRPPVSRRTRAQSGADALVRARPPGCAPDLDLDLTFVDQAVSQFGRAKESAIPLLQAIQTHYRYLPDDALRRVCELTEITPAEIAGTSSFYGQFRRSPVGEHIVRVCHGTACHVSGARQITEELRRYLAIPDGEDTDAARMFTLDEVACLGCCSLAPVLMVDGHTAGKLTPATACDALKVTA